MSELILTAKNLHKNYRNAAKEVRAVNGVNLNLKRGSSTAIIGPSGAGKSTLLHLLGGLDNPSSGEVMLNGINIYKLQDRERANIRNRQIGFVFQFYHLLPEFTALENVMLPSLMKRQSVRISGHQSLKESSRELLKSVGLSHRLSHRPAELSGGESQRVAIARALANNPQVLLCDEPTGNLDSKTSESIYELLFDLKTKTNMTLVVVTHDENISKRVEETIHIKDGKIL
jgi:lipoprotein-releasing system ATP-binding protein